MPRHATILKTEAGGAMIVHTSKPAKACSVCGARLAHLLCDGLLGHKKTCDRALCKQCAYHVEPDLDYCPDHRPGLKENTHV